MTEFEKQQFWAALGRLYSTTLEQTKHIEALRAESDTQRQSIGELFQIARTHQDSIIALRDTAATHEKRLDRYEVTVTAILEELRKLRPGA